MKLCKVCELEKTPDEFYIKDRKTERYDTTCKECKKKQTKAWHFDNHQVSLENKKKWHEKNRDKMLSNMKQNYQRRMQENPEQRRKWRLENKDRCNELARKSYVRRMQTDVNYKLMKNIRSACNRIIFHGGKKSRSLELLGCKVDFVRDWLEQQFDENMNWNNHGSYWHIDHVIPLSCFNLENTPEQFTCFNWSNLQPLSGRLNLQKHCKPPDKLTHKQHLQKVIEFCKTNNIEEKSVLRLYEGTIDDKQLDSLH